MLDKPAFEDGKVLTLTHLSRVVPNQRHAKSRQTQPQLQAAQIPTTDMISNLMSNHHPAEAGITNLGHSLIDAPMAAGPGGEHYQYDSGGISVPAYNNMAAMSFPSQAQVHEPYLQSVTVYQQNISSDAMSNYGRRQMDATMGILSAERYDDGGAATRSNVRGQRVGQQQSPSAIFGLSMEDEQRRGGARAQNQAHRQRRPQSPERAGGDRRRKKQKLSEDEEGEDEASKKARGRPRLDTKDETAADRRRTQIRMAQRAYRHRKETTISSLEKQVQELKGANEEMSNIFLNLHDFALQRGILDREREFSNHLKSSTERFLALAKSIAADESGREDDANSADGRKPTDSPDPESSRQSRQIIPLPTSQLGNSTSMEPHPSEMWGYQVTKEDERDNVSQNNQIDMDLPDLDSFLSMPLRQGQHQIISRATPYNASFSFDTDIDYLQQFRAEVPDIFETYQNNVAFQETLPLPKSLAKHERTFGRHLQRAALQQGLALITDPEASPALLHKAFGFCLRFETRDQIETRLKNCVDTNIKDPLFHWNAPFVHLGGSGTYYPLDEDIAGTLMPKFRTGMSMGPFSSSVTETKDTAMLDDFRMKEPGFEGPWFDSNDVENYLRGRGIDIPPNVEFITINLDVLSLRDTSSSISLSDSALSNSYSTPKTPSSPEIRFSQLLSGSDTYNPNIDVSRITDGTNNASTIGFSAQFDDWANTIPIESSLSTGKSVQNHFDLTGPIFNSATDSSVDIPAENTFTQDRLVTVSVTVLVEELLRNTVCLGRAPGFRPFDVDSAIHRAVNKGF